MEVHIPLPRHPREAVVHFNLAELKFVQRELHNSPETFVLLTGADSFVPNRGIGNNHGQMP